MKPRRKNPLTCANGIALGALIAIAAIPAAATPANKLALKRHFGDFLPPGLNQCSTCHLPGGDHAAESLEDIPHNAFGARLREAAGDNGAISIADRLTRIAREDADGDGANNRVEILLGSNPGNAAEPPSVHAIETAADRERAFLNHLESAYPWRPFKPVKRPPVPEVSAGDWVRNPIDAFIAKAHEERSLRPRPKAKPEALLRRLYLDLIGLSPPPEAVTRYLADPSEKAYEQIVDELLAHPRYGERWGRHWMDIWRYSDWAGYKKAIRDSQRHIWRWRDWIVESLNQNKPYDRMIHEMLAADEIAPLDEDALRATGFIARNWKAGSREKWLTDLVDHTMQGFMGVTFGCAKCHEHKYDPIPQEEYYRLRAIFAPHGVRTERLPGQPDLLKDGLPRAYEQNPSAAVYLLKRGDERHPIKDKEMAPGVPAIFGGVFEPKPVTLPRLAYEPDKRDFVIQETLAASRARIAKAKTTLNSLRDQKPPADTLKLAELDLAAVLARHEALMATLEVERVEDGGGKKSSAWRTAAIRAHTLQRQAALAEAEHAHAAARAAEAGAEASATRARTAAKGKPTSATKKAAASLAAAKKKTQAADKALKKARKDIAAEATPAYTPRKIAKYSATSTGRRTAFAHWLTDRANPLTARVAMNHVWLRRFGSAIVPTVGEFGANGVSPTHPALLDWLAAEFMDRDWNMKEMHKLIAISSAYRMASTFDAAAAAIDPDNRFLWRMNSRRMEAEVVRDNLLHICGSMDNAMGGPDIPNTQGQTSRRSSIHLRHAHEKLVEFLQIFDGPNVVECYERKKTVQPHQALALANSRLTFVHAGALSDTLNQTSSDDDAFVRDAYLRVLSREPTDDELNLCREFLNEQASWLRSKAPPSAKEPPRQRARRNLLMTLFNHNDFVTVR